MTRTMSLQTLQRLLAHLVRVYTRSAVPLVTLYLPLLSNCSQMATLQC